MKRSRSPAAGDRGAEDDRDAAPDLVPRVYQLELLEMAKERNVVAYLDTGSGKTFISLLLLKHRIERHAALVAAGAAPQHRWLGAFLAPQVALVHQQADVLGRSLPVRVRAFVGTDASSWDAAKWAKQLEEVDILVCTPQILVNVLMHRYLPGIGCFDVLCFDEAHHCTGKHPYAQIMRSYHEAAQGARPLIFGMSAAPVTSGKQKQQSYVALRKNIQQLEANMDARIVTVVNRAALEEVSPPPALTLVRYPPLALTSSVEQLHDRLERAQLRVHLAAAVAQLQWTQDLQRSVGFVGAHPEASSIMFQAGAPIFRSSKVKEVLGAVLHVLANLGAYCAARAAAAALRWPLPGDQGSCEPLQAGCSGLPTDQAAGDAQLNGACSMDCAPSSAEEALAAEAQGAAAAAEAEAAAGGGAAEAGADAGATPGSDVQAKQLAADQAATQLQWLQGEAQNAGIAWADVINEPQAANLSVADALLAFLESFAAWGDCAHTLGALADQLRHAAGDPVALSTLAPADVMQDVVDSVTTAALQASLEQALPHPNVCHAHDAPELVSPKAAALLQLLLQYRQSSQEQHLWTAIVFVKQRMAALALQCLLEALPCTAEWLRCSAFMAQGSAIGAFSAFKPKQQADILTRFRKGELNLLVSTSVAEEGIDIKTCQLVVRFDLPDSAQSFLQSRGRARMRNSHLAVLIKAGDPEQEALVERMVDYEAKLRQGALANVERLQQLKEQGQGDHEDGGAAKWHSVLGPAGVYVVEATGARLTPDTAQGLLHRFTAMLPADKYTSLRPVYRVEILKDGRIQATVQLPSASPLHSVKGLPVSGKHSFARAAAALEACRQLHLMGALNDHLLPAVLDDKHISAAAPAVPAEVDPQLQAMSLNAVLPEQLAAEIGELEGAHTALLQGYVWHEVDQPSEPSAHGDRLHIALLVPTTLAVVPELTPFILGGAACVQLVRSFDVRLDMAQMEMLRTCSTALRQLAGGPCARAAGHTYMLVPLVPAATCEKTREIDWSMAEEVATFAAAAAEGRTALQIMTALGAGRLDGKLLTTTYNKRTYVFKCIAEGVTVHTSFERTFRRRGTAKGTPPAVDQGQTAMEVDCQAAAQEEVPTDAVDDADVSDDVEDAMYADAGGADPPAALQTHPRVHSDDATEQKVLEPSTGCIPLGTAPEGASAEEVLLQQDDDAMEDAMAAEMQPGEAGAGPLGSSKVKLLTYLEYYTNRWDVKDVQLDQPVVEVQRTAMKALRGLKKRKEEEEDGVINLLPQLCTVHAVPAALWPSAAAAHTLMWQLEGSLAAEELLREMEAAVGSDPPPGWRLPPLNVLRVAITARSALDPTGDYESLETVGDAFLKFAASAQLFLQHRHYHEGQLTKLRGKVVSNSRLLEVALKLGLDRKVRVAPAVDADYKRDAASVAIRNAKVLSDVVESLVGAFLVGGGQPAALALLHHLGLVPIVTLPPLEELAPESEPEQEGSVPAIEAILGYTFTAKWLPVEAMTHGSLVGSRCYQRLEFLGDAVLDYALTHHLYTHFPGSTPSQLHDARSAAVNSERLALAAVHHRLQTHIRHLSPPLFGLMDSFAQEVEDQVAALTRPPQHRTHARPGQTGHESIPTAEGAAAAGANPPAAALPEPLAEGQAWDRVLTENAFGLDSMAAPKALSDVVEALVGAVWMDSRGSVEAAWAAACRLISPMPEVGDHVVINPVRQLRELAAKSGVQVSFKEVAGSHLSAGGTVAMQVVSNGAVLAQGLPAGNSTTASRLAAQAALAVWPKGAGNGGRG